MKRFLALSLLTFAMNLTPALASSAKPADRKPASVPGSDLNQPLEIKGQSRMLNMRLMIQNKRDKLKFVEPRRDYREEILKTQY